MYMCRWFYPIGQGGFAFEQFKNGNTVVFDCGSETIFGERSIIEDRICQAFPIRDKKSIISNVFISHFHKDHINGLPFLLKQCAVSNIYLPYLTESEQVITLILLSEELNSRYMRLFHSLITGNGIGRSAESQNTQVTYVHPTGDKLGPIDESKKVEHVGSGCEIPASKQKDSKKPWFFIPYTFDNKNRSEKFKRILQENGISDSLCEEMRNSAFWENNEVMEIVKKAYENIRKDINLTNMVVYSGTKSFEPTSCLKLITSNKIKQMIQDGIYPINPHRDGCLYTGDYNAKAVREWKALKNAYNGIWNTIGVCTVPHHGSKNSFNAELTKLDSFFVINAGCNNSYKHPHREVLQSLQKQHKEVFVINEFSNSDVLMFYFDVIE